MFGGYDEAKRIAQEEKAVKKKARAKAKKSKVMKVKIRSPKIIRKPKTKKK